jgi:hypothetical protein
LNLETQIENSHSEAETEESVDEAVWF